MFFCHFLKGRCKNVNEDFCNWRKKILSNKTNIERDRDRLSSYKFSNLFRCCKDNLSVYQGLNLICWFDLRHRTIFASAQTDSIIIISLVFTRLSLNSWYIRYKCVSLCLSYIGSTCTDVNDPTAWRILSTFFIGM